jgi:hypothetical protein
MDYHVSKKIIRENSKVTHPMSLTDRSGSRKNSYIQTFGKIYDEVPWHSNETIRNPHFPTFARNSKKAGIFTTTEIYRRKSMYGFTVKLFL